MFYARNNENDFRNITDTFNDDLQIAVRHASVLEIARIIKQKFSTSFSRSLQMSASQAKSGERRLSKDSDLQRERGCWSRLILAVVTNLLNLHGNLQFSDFLKCVITLSIARQAKNTRLPAVSPRQNAHSARFVAVFRVYGDYGKCELSTLQCAMQGTHRSPEDFQTS